MHIKNRNIQKYIFELLNSFPAVVVLGARQVGKSTLLKLLLPNANYFDLERRSDFQRVSDDPELIFRETDGPYDFDEAQLSPSLFNALRVEIDRHRERKGVVKMSRGHIRDTGLICYLLNKTWFKLALITVK